MTERWWDKYAAEDAAKEVVAEEVLEPKTCGCGWTGIPIDHPKIDPLLCGECLKGLPGTERGKSVARCPVCGSHRLTADDQACLECDWPDVELSTPEERSLVND